MSIAELRRLPAGEKLEIIELLWADFAAGLEAYTSPAWHGEELASTEDDFKKGLIETVAWEDAKSELRRRFE
jgi:putative addiction module component (TIGR02574 family)